MYPPLTPLDKPPSVPSPTACETRYIALDVSEAMFSPPAHTATRRSKAYTR